MKKVVSYSLCSYYVEGYFNDRVLSNASCFFVRGKKNDYLVTNWHVISDRNSDTNELLNSYGAIPNLLKVDLPNDLNTDSPYWSDSMCEFSLVDNNNIKKYLEKK